MKIAFLLGLPDISGGTYVIFEHATRLARMGHHVLVVTKECIEERRYAWHPSARELSWKTFSELQDEEMDMAIATWWQSVYELHQIQSRKYLYFVQSIESRFLPKRDPDNPALRDIDILAQWFESTYRVALPVITEAKWIQEYLLEHHNRSSILVRNGIRKDIYTENGSALAPRQEGKLRVLVEGPLGVFIKNVEKTIELCQQADVDEIWLLTSSDISEYEGVDSCFSKVPILETPEIYRSCDVLVKLSYVEGMFGPPLEMFHCGGTAIVYDVTGHDEYIRHGINSLVVSCDDEASVVRCLQRLKKDEELLEDLKAGAKLTAQEWPDWDATATEFHLALLEFAENTPDMSRTFLRENNDFFLSVKENELRARELSRMSAREVHGRDGETSSHNFIQVYWDSGSGIQAETSDHYTDNSWCKRNVVIDSDLPPKVIRVDPSLHIGVVAIRSLKVSGKDSGEIFGHWFEGGNWSDIVVTGTACLLKNEPYLLLEAYGEDPQLFLPQIPGLLNGESLKIEVEVREMSFAQALVNFVDRNSRKRFPGEKRIRNLIRKLWNCFGKR